MKLLPRKRSQLHIWSVFCRFYCVFIHCRISHWLMLSMLSVFNYFVHVVSDKKTTDDNDGNCYSQCDCWFGSMLLAGHLPRDIEQTLSCKYVWLGTSEIKNFAHSLNEWERKFCPIFPFDSVSKCVPKWDLLDWN